MSNPPITQPTPLLMTKEYWMSSPLSVVRHFGQCQYNGHRYIIVDKQGRDLWECSAVAEKEGRTLAIEPLEPADLIWEGLQPHYKRLGRDRIIAMIQDGNTLDQIAATPAHHAAAQELTIDN